jgi:hypothetical protein
MFMEVICMQKEVNVVEGLEHVLVTIFVWKGHSLCNKLYRIVM